MLLVLGRHWVPAPDGVAAVPAALINTWERCGWIGVDLFFVLSGFLIAGLLFREHQAHGTIGVRRFLVRRGFKIYPAFYVFLAFTLLFSGAGPGRVEPGAVLAEVLFVQNYAGRVLPHSWSLAVEEHFYLLLPLLLLVLSRRGRGTPDPFRPLVGLFCVTAAAVLAGRVITAWQLPFSAGTHVFATHLRIDSLLFGVVLSYAHHYHGPRMLAAARRRRRFLLPAGLLLVLPSLWVPLEHRFMHTAGFSLLYVGFGLVLLAGLYADAPPGPAANLLATIGRYSYSIYLWHIFMRHAGLRVLPDLPYPAQLAAYVFGSIVIGVGMSGLVEYRALKLRDRLFPSLCRPLAPPESALASAPAMRDNPDPDGCRAESEKEAFQWDSRSPADVSPPA